LSVSGRRSPRKTGEAGKLVSIVGRTGEAGRRPEVHILLAQDQPVSSRRQAPASCRPTLPAEANPPRHRPGSPPGPEGCRSDSAALRPTACRGPGRTSPIPVASPLPALSREAPVLLVPPRRRSGGRGGPCVRARTRTTNEVANTRKQSWRIAPPLRDPASIISGGSRAGPNLPGRWRPC